MSEQDREIMRQVALLPTVWGWLTTALEVNGVAEMTATDGSRLQVHSIGLHGCPGTRVIAKQSVTNEWIVTAAACEPDTDKSMVA